MWSRLYYSYKLYFYKKIGYRIPGATIIQDFLAKLATRDLQKISEKNLISDKEWDNLIILDACRHDLYEEVNGKTDFRYSAGSHSRDFMRENFSEGDWSDTIYISANGHSSPSMFEDLTGRKPEEVFHVFYNTWDNEWDEEEKIVLPQSVVKDAKSAEKLFPEKKKIIHFMQPHYPFLNHDKDFHWDDVAFGRVSEERAWRAYKENLEYVMPYIDELVGRLEGRTVITSDHGNLVGENGMYDHPEGLDVEVLRKVPWEVRR